MALALTATLGALGAAELVARGLDPHRIDALDMSAFTRPSTSAEQRTELIPGAGNPHFLGGPVRVNAMGLRGVEPAAPKHGERLLAIGDSVTFGYGVGEEEVWQAQLARLRARPERPVEAVNAGLSGAGLRYYRRAMRERCAPLAPDRVLVGLVLNDIATYAEPAPGGARKRTGAVVNRALMRHSHLYAAAVPMAKGVAYTLGVLDLNDNPGFSFVALEDPGPRQEAAWADSLALLDDIVAEADACGAPLTLLMFPVEMQLSEEALSLYRDGLGLRIGAGAQEGAAQRRVQAWADARGVDFVDLMPAFQAARSDGAELYLRSEAVALDPVHPSAAGHAVTAKVLAAHLDAPPADRATAGR